MLVMRALGDLILAWLLASTHEAQPLHTVRANRDQLLQIPNYETSWWPHASVSPSRATSMPPFGAAPLAGDIFYYSEDYAFFGRAIAGRWRGFRGGVGGLGG
jgi:hypothetical protein